MRTARICPPFPLPLCVGLNPSPIIHTFFCRQKRLDGWFAPWQTTVSIRATRARSREVCQDTYFGGMGRDSLAEIPA